MLALRRLAPLSPRQVVPGKKALLRELAPLPPKQLVFQVVSCPQAGSSWEDSASQAASASTPQTVNAQAVSSTSSQAVSTDPQVVSTSASQAGSPWEDSTAQAASTSSQTHSTNSQGASATLPQAPQASRQPTSTNTPRDLQEATHWKIPTINRSSIYPVNL